MFQNNAIKITPVNTCGHVHTILANKRKYLTYWSMNTFFWQEVKNQAFVTCFFSSVIRQVEMGILRLLLSDVALRVHESSPSF
ncbi:MAG: hypothetical protein ACFCAD_06840 [Pleurocapsa sp.]